LAPEDYGIYALFLTAALICEPLLTLCVSDAIAHVYYNPRYDTGEYISTFFIFCAGMFAAQMVCLWGGTFLPVFAIPLWLLCAPVVALSNISVGVLGIIWQLQEKPVPYGRLNFCYFLSQLLLQMGAVVFLRLGWRGVLGAQVLLALLMIPLALLFLRKNGWLAPRFNKDCLRFGLKFGMALMPNAFAVRFNDSVGKLLLSQMFSMTEMGVYAAGQKLGGIVNVYNQAMGNTYRPWLFRKLADGFVRNRRKIILSVPLAFASTLLFAWGGSFCMYLFSGFIFGRDYSGAIVYVFWSASAYALNGMYNVVSLFIYHTGKSWILSLLTVTTVGLNVLFTWRFIQLYGIIGAAYAPILAWVITLVLSIMVVRKL
jgi:O-antigen/teichoic acid export membrane protein